MPLFICGELGSLLTDDGRRMRDVARMFASQKSSYCISGEITR